MLALMRQPPRGRSIEYVDNRISLFSAQWGKCAVTGCEFGNTAEIHCNHKIPKSKCGNDKYDNLVLVSKPIHELIHAVNPVAISKYLSELELNKEQVQKVNRLREIAELPLLK
jgi:CRISPR/Cas system Type II protein with McrA/HNH and RuvC-like nuclease domain